jgi:tetratricopeptide (TPR) repeat protein
MRLRKRVRRLARRTLPPMSALLALSMASAPKPASAGTSEPEGSAATALGLDSCQKELPRMKSRTHTQPTDSRNRADLATCELIIGGYRLEQDDWASNGAYASLQDSIATWEILTAGNHSNHEWQHELVVAQIAMGNLLSKQGDQDGALKSYENARDLLDDLASLPPSEIQIGVQARQFELAQVQTEIARIHRDEGDRTDARASYQDAQVTLGGLVAALPVTDLRHSRAAARLASVEAELRQLQELPPPPEDTPPPVVTPPTVATPPPASPPPASPPVTTLPPVRQSEPLPEVNPSPFHIPKTKVLGIIDVDYDFTGKNFETFGVNGEPQTLTAGQGATASGGLGLRPFSLPFGFYATAGKRWALQAVDNSGQDTIQNDGMDATVYRAEAFVDLARHFRISGGPVWNRSIKVVGGAFDPGFQDATGYTVSAALCGIGVSFTKIRYRSPFTGDLDTQSIGVTFTGLFGGKH